MKSRSANGTFVIIRRVGIGRGARLRSQFSPERRGSELRPRCFGSGGRGSTGRGAGPPPAGGAARFLLRVRSTTGDRVSGTLPPHPGAPRRLGPPPSWPPSAGARPPGARSGDLTALPRERRGRRARGPRGAPGTPYPAPTRARAPRKLLDHILRPGPGFSPLVFSQTRV